MRFKISFFNLLLLLCSFDAGAKSLKDLVTSRIGRLVPSGNGIFHVSYTYTPDSNFSDISSDDVSYHDVDVGLSGAIPLKDKTFFGFGAQYALQDFDISNISGYLPQDSLTVHRVGLPLDVFTLLNQNWVLDFNFTPRLQSDFKSLDGDAFQFRGRVAAGHAFSDATAFFFGLSIGKGFANYIPLPTIAFVYRPKDSPYSFQTIVPEFFKAAYQVMKPLSLFVKGEVGYHTWDIQETDGVPDHLLKFTDSHIGLGMDYEIKRGIMFEIFGGANPYRKLEFTDVAGNDVSRRLDVGGFIQSMIYLKSDLFVKR